MLSVLDLKYISHLLTLVMDLTYPHQGHLPLHKQWAEVWWEMGLKPLQEKKLKTSYQALLLAVYLPRLLILDNFNLPFLELQIANENGLLGELS